MAMGKVGLQIGNLLWNLDPMAVHLEPTTSWALFNRNVAAPSKYTGMLQASKDIFREEGFAVLVEEREDELKDVMTIAFADLNKKKWKGVHV